MNKKFSIRFNDIEQLFINIEKLNLTSEKPIIKLYKSANFTSPIQDISFNFNKNIDGSICFLCVIKKDIYSKEPHKNFDKAIARINESYKTIALQNCIAIINDDENQKLIIRNIENFGIYIFSGRPDLISDKYFNANLEYNFVNFKLFIEILCDAIEIIVNAIYKDLELLEKIKLTIEPITFNEEILNNCKETKLPGALKRFYDKIGVSY